MVIKTKMLKSYVLAYEHNNGGQKNIGVRKFINYMIRGGTTLDKLEEELKKIDKQIQGLNNTLQKLSQDHMAASNAVERDIGRIPEYDIINQRIANNLDEWDTADEQPFGDGQGYMAIDSPFNVTAIGDNAESNAERQKLRLDKIEENGNRMRRKRKNMEDNRKKCKRHKLKTARVDLINEKIAVVNKKMKTLNEQRINIQNQINAIKPIEL